MRTEEYLQRVTSYISEPAAAAEVYRELKAHLCEANADLTAKGIDLETAEAVAVERMGPPDELGRSLGAVHHRHLPWRHYLALLALIPFIGSLLLHSTQAAIWFLVLTVCLFPGTRFWQQIWRTIQVDVCAKRQWLREQPLREAALAGGITGAAAALFYVSLLHWGSHTIWLLRREYFMLWLATVVIALLAQIPARRLYRGPLLPALGFAAAAFAIVSLPFSSPPWPRSIDLRIGWWLLTSGSFAVALLISGAVVRQFQRLWVRVRVPSGG